MITVAVNEIKLVDGTFEIWNGGEIVNTFTEEDSTGYEQVDDVYVGASVVVDEVETRYSAE